jgi:hypothetical protein
MNYDDVIEFLKREGKKIGQQKTPEAIAVMEAYQFHYAAPGDPGGQGLLIEAVEKYIKNNQGDVICQKNSIMNRT